MSKGEVQAGGPVLLVAADGLLPFGERPASGTGLRIHSLGRALQDAGLPVRFALPAHATTAPGMLPPEVQELLWRPGRLAGLVRDLAPRAAVVAHWRVLAAEGPLPVPTVLDLHGPLLLENAHLPEPLPLPLAVHSKLRAFRQADFLTCAGERQRHYFAAWSILAGRDPQAAELVTVPLGFSPELPERRAAVRRPDTFPTVVHAGFFLPWQDPTPALAVAAATLERRQAGRLLVFGGPHPALGAPPERLSEYRRTLAGHPRAEDRGLVPHARLLEALLGEGDVALDLLPHTAERELAVSTRAVEYLWCGLPLLVDEETELAGEIRDWGAGWPIPADDRAALAEVLESIVDRPAEVAERAEAARELVRRRHVWSAAAEPLVRFCRSPRFARPGDDRPGPVLLSETAEPHRGYLGMLRHYYRLGGTGRAVSEALRALGPRRQVLR